MGYLIASLGWLPSPAAVSRLVAVAAQERYPCEGCGCGCSSQRECWTQCCCHTLEQRVRWARLTGVEIPPYVDLSGLGSDTLAVCSLCPSGSSTPEETPAREAPALPRMGALACKGLASVLASAVVPAVWGGGVAFDLPPLPSSDGPSDEGVASMWRSLGTPEPPPRES